jgi:hypothetical protein
LRATDVDRWETGTDDGFEWETPDDDDFIGDDLRRKHKTTKYNIVNNKTGQVVGHLTHSTDEPRGRGEVYGKKFTPFRNSSAESSVRR